jgi:hypothetical protein
LFLLFFSVIPSSPHPFLSPRFCSSQLLLPSLPFISFTSPLFLRKSEDILFCSVEPCPCPCSFVPWLC